MCEDFLRINTLLGRTGRENQVPTSTPSLALSPLPRIAYVTRLAPDTPRNLQPRSRPQAARPHPKHSKELLSVTHNLALNSSRDNIASGNMSQGKSQSFSTGCLINEPATESACKARRLPNACERCRLRHQKCDNGPGRDICSNCDRASAICKGGGDKELRIRFSNIGRKQPRRCISTRDRLAAPMQAPSGDAPVVIAQSIEDAGGDHHAAPVRINSASPETTSSHSRGHTYQFTELQSQESPKPPQHTNSSPSPSSGALRPATSASETGSPMDQTPPPVMQMDYSELGTSSSANHSEPIDLHPPSMSFPNFLTTRWEPSHSESRNISTGCDSTSPLNQSDKSCLWPLAEDEALLVKHFFNVLVSWFDYCDPQMHFRAYVGSTASHDATVLYAVLAISAKHREVTMGVDGHRSIEYERQCLEALIPSLNDTTKVLHEPLLASALLLRLLNEMTEPAEGEFISTHAVSAPVLLQIKQGNIQSSSFSDVAMMVALRQEIFVANMTKREVGPIADHCNVDASLEPAPDVMWTSRIIAHTARVTNFVYGHGAKYAAQWDQLWQYLCDWDRHKPDSFRPIYYAHRATSSSGCRGTDKHRYGSAGSYLHRICYAYDCPIAAQQYMQLCRILLLAHDPRTPVLGLGRAEFQRHRDEEIREAVRILCSISVSNPEYMPATCTAGLAIAMCGELFTEPGETTELLRIVSEAELHLGWPSLKVSYKLQSFWGLFDFSF
ncbi:Uncharacterized protein TPAR_04457 [Tolypocladium paradoxum]|uniref:Zn(2)-C6 fungal-type domain-containing protein n=1 Tax=Tolypocladium paradoxum TaxID=94208 RepID=A0A2S4KYQ9_9HYPO|nr:Uncharacterized protein TPAR_04457 [Tolypocladium paradoxum]